MFEGDDIIAAMQQSQRVICRAHAQQLKAMVALADMRENDGPEAQNYVPDEIALALNISRTAANLRLGLAYELVERLPATLAALEAGEIDLTRAHAISDATSPLSVEHAAAVEARVLEKAKDQNAPQLRRALNAPCSPSTLTAARPVTRNAARSGAWSSVRIWTACPG